VLAASAVSVHGWHFAAAAAFLLAGLAAAAVADARESREGAARRARPEFAKPLLVICAVATVVAAAVHVFVIPEHFDESALYGTFFVSLAAVQLGWAAMAVMRPSLRVLSAGIAGNVAVVLLWLATRLVAVPLGPGAGTREEIGALDVLATSCELVVIVAAAVLLTSRGRRPEALVST